MQRLLIIHRLAKAEARKAFRWYEKKSLRAAMGFEKELVAAISRIESNPKQYGVYLHNARACRVHRYPYILVYHFDHREIQIISVSHGKKKPGHWRKRLM